MATPTLARERGERGESKVATALGSGGDAPDGVEDGEDGVAGGVAPVARILGGEGGGVGEGREENGAVLDQQRMGGGVYDERRGFVPTRGEQRAEEEEEEACVPVTPLARRGDEHGEQVGVLQHGSDLRGYG